MCCEPLVKDRKAYYNTLVEDRKIGKRVPEPRMMQIQRILFSRTRA